MARIAVVGAGISGLTAAWYLGRRHEVTVYEHEHRAGGHTCTIPVSRDSGDYQVDVGFIVFNDRTYPNFNALIDELGIGRQAAPMGFAVSAEATGVEYSGDGLGGVFAQKRNLLSPGHWRMVLDILRFNREAPSLLESDDGEMPLGDYLRREGYSERFCSHYILAMGGAIWSCSDEQMAQFPARFFVRFFLNHGLLALKDRPQWYVVPGGSSRYVEKMLESLPATLHLGMPVTAVTRGNDGVQVHTGHGQPEHFDQVVLACHSDQALRLLSDADQQERANLERLPYQDNEVVLHTDERLLPRNRRTWSSWNALLPAAREERVQITYNMNILQSLPGPETFCVTLNAGDRIDPSKIIDRRVFSHPLFTPEGVNARQQLLDSNGRNRTWFCGAWCRNGFHEDGVVSALNVVNAMEAANV